MTENSKASSGGSAPANARPQRSLAGRLVLVAGVWSAITLALAGFFLVELYRGASERAFDAQLEVHIKALISEMLQEGGGTPDAETAIQQPVYAGDPRFSLPLSGWYWIVRESGKPEIAFASRSLVGDPLDVPMLGEARSRADFAFGPTGDEIRVLQERIGIGGTDYVIAVGAATAGLRAEVGEFARQVTWALCIAGLGLILAVFLQVRVGLRPLQRLKVSLSAVRQGTAERIDEDLPREIAPLAIELNALIVSNREIVERARTHVGNLAHGLKTPLSVITNEARGDDSALGRKVGEQASIMSDQIQHHLERARMAAQRRVIGVSCDTVPVLERLVRAMEKIHRDKDLQIDLAAQIAVRFRGEAQDLEEMCGNLIDNACKWSASAVRIALRPLDETGSGRLMFELTVEDDGPGLSEEQRSEAVKRGRRLDETVPGTGLGLSIVADLAALYGGRFELDRAALGGLKARIVLPALEEA